MTNPRATEPQEHVSPPLEPEPGEPEPAGVTGSPSIPEEGPEVGLSQKGSGEKAVVRRETEI